MPYPGALVQCGPLDPAIIPRQSSAGTLCYHLSPNLSYVVRYMGAISLRLPEDLERKLAQEAELVGRPRSEVIRDALTQFIAQRERERFMAEMVAAAKALYADPEARAEALQIAEDFLEAENEALDIAEGRRPGEPWPEESGEPWWK